MPEAEIWDPRGGHTQMVSSLLEPPRIGHAATLLIGGLVELSGGVDPSGKPLTVTTAFDPKSEQFVVVGTNSLVTPIDGMSPPTLAASIPASNATDFPADGLIALRFSEPMDTRSINAKTITLLGPGGNTPIKVVGAEDGRLAFVTPTTDLYPSAHYTLFLQGVMSQRNRGLSFIAIDFSVAALPGPNRGDNPSGNASPQEALNKSTSSASPTAKATSSSPESAQLPALHLVTGSAGRGSISAGPCGVPGGSLQKLCRAKSIMDQGAWYPGQDAVGNALGGHWRLNKSDITPQEIAYAVLMRKVRGGKGPTGISGRIELIDDSPIANVDVSIGAVHVRTNAHGDFTLKGVPAGHQELFVDGTTANTPGHEYGQFLVGVDLNAGVILPLDYRMYLPRILDRDEINIPSPTTQDLVIT
ncbi:MAG: Ig-like domain-containing protein, partial [bacterium]